ncbi:calcium proton exchanger [Neofusicoccum parvum]|uniref:Calcium proton exchanger n=1 Tax=Neofusicoccum parvum TaxID=310453 RepID=A0ACB5SIN4_9PEZI|nr:calcium proton exchanger [Neofusicoccum parvum]
MPGGEDRRQIRSDGEEEAENSPLLPPDRRDSALDTQSRENDRQTGKPARGNQRDSVLQRIGIPIARIVHHVIWFPPFALIAENFWRLLTTNLYYTASFLTFVPLGILASVLTWKTELIIVFNALAVGSASFLATVFAEELVQSSTLHLEFLVELIFTNTAWLFIGVLALLRSEFHMIQAIIPGSILTRDMLFLGISFLAGSFHHRIQHISSRTVISTMTSLKIVGLIPLAICSLLPPSSPPPLFLPRALSVISLTLYALYHLFRTTTHTPLFTSPSPSPRRPRPSPRPPTATACLLLTTTLATLLSSALLLAALPPSPPPALLTTLLPLLLHHAELPAAVRSGGAAALVATSGATLHAELWCAPGLVVAGWAGGVAVWVGPGRAAAVVAVGVGAWVGGVVVGDGRGEYLKGGVLVVL